MQVNNVGRGFDNPFISSQDSYKQITNNKNELGGISPLYRIAPRNLQALAPALEMYSQDITNLIGGNVSKISIESLKDIQKTLEVFLNKSVSDEQKATALTGLLSKLSKVNFTGSINVPQKIDGKLVIGSTMTADGTHGFMLEDGKVVSRESLVKAQNLGLAINLVGLMMGGGENTDKVLGIAENAVLLANTNDLLSDTASEYLTSGIGLAGAISKWDQLSDKERANTISNITPLVLKGAKDLGLDLTEGAGGIGSFISAVGGLANWNELSDEKRAAALGNAGLSAVNISDDLLGSALGSSAGAVFGALSGGLSIYSGIKDGINVFETLSDLPRSIGREYGAIGGGMSGAAVGAGIGGLMAVSGVSAGALLGAKLGTFAFPVVGTLIGGALGAAAGFLAGSFGSGKKVDQKMRDQWRDGLEQMGMAKVIDKSHRVTLADGSLYNIGSDGNDKLQNVDGTKRHTFDIDWANPLSADAIPEAHILAMATGLDPSMDDKLWHRAVAQLANAGLSNAKDGETVSDNFRAMLIEGKVDPRQIALKIEVLRQEGVISETDYAVYMDKINKLFNIKLASLTKEEAGALLMANAG